MLAFAFRGLWWFVGSVAVTLGFLLIPLETAAQRKQLEKTVAQIAQAKRDIRSLETEFETRGNIAQLEKWNGETLRLAAPAVSQFMPDEAALAQVDFSVPQGQPMVQMAALVVPSHPGAVAVAPIVPPATVAPTGATPPAPGTVAPVRTAPMRSAAIVGVRPQAVAMLDRKLLSDSMIGDLASAATAEGGSSR